jgi:hypothetical protein
MMEAVAENEHQSGPPAIREPGEPLPAPRASQPEPAPIDPEAVRQFQQFQQFQELMRQQGDVALVPPPTRKSLVRRVFRNPFVRWPLIIVITVVILVLLGLLAAYLLLQHFFGHNEEQGPASVVGGRSYTNRTILAGSPHEAVRKVYQRVADDSPEFVCGQFNSAAAQQFADDFQAGTCEDAVHQINARIDKTQKGYKNTWADYQGLPLTLGGMDLKNPPAGVTSVEISSCDVTVSPKLGAFKLQKVERDQWIIVEHRKETC